MISNFSTHFTKNKSGKPNNPLVLTLDAGGTNFVFDAIQSVKQIAIPITQPSHAHDLNKCLEGMVQGFNALIAQLGQQPDAISFAFPGPADYQNGIIGNLGNLPAFRGGVALGPMLEHIFKVPVFINNDGDLFTYGESQYGFLPELNNKLTENSLQKRYKNLIGITIGTGFGGGIVRNSSLLLGDNGASGEVWLLRNFINPNTFAEEGISARAITQKYCSESRTPANGLQPHDVYQIAKGTRIGNQHAALLAFETMGKALGDALAEVITLFDANVVIGGGLSAAHDLFFPSMIQQMNSSFAEPKGSSVKRLESTIYNFENPNDLKTFLNSNRVEVVVPVSGAVIPYHADKKLCVGVSRLGTNKAVALGAYAFAVQQLQG